ncbi:MAG: hypothetical protein ACREGD_03215 [Candidatus Saccharimonadales bacterium]
MRKLLIAAVLLGGLFWVVSNNSRGSEEQPPAQDQQSAEQADESETEGASTEEEHQAAVYNYVTQRGDSYTEMARKAVQAYAQQQEAAVSEAGIIFAETNLTKLAGSPRLEIGQQVAFAEEALKEWVEKAQNLSVAQQAAWNRYVSAVNFDTSLVGVAR